MGTSPFSAVGMLRPPSFGGKFLMCGLRELDQLAIKFLLYNSVILKGVASMIWKRPLKGQGTKIDIYLKSFLIKNIIYGFNLPLIT